MRRLPRPAALSTLAVGSLPHTQLELAMQQAMRVDVPALPQLPRCGPSELMLPQALEGLPGMRFDSEGSTRIDERVWKRGARALDERLDRALEGDVDALESLEPDAAFCRAWRPFLWEIEQRGLTFAKAQIAGPLTARWATLLDDGRPLSEQPEIEAQVLKLITARALAMARAITERGAQPLIFLDEPGLYAFERRRPSHSVQLEQLRFVFTALRRTGAITGLHCCSNTDWERVLATSPDMLAVDVRLSLSAILSAGAALNTFLVGGGTLVLGIVPTHSTERVDPEELVAGLLALTGERRGPLLARALLSPACGLGLRTVAESQSIHEDLAEVQQLLKRPAA